MNDNTIKCLNCKYFKRKTQTERNNAYSEQEANLGKCKRYPQDHKKSRDDYCGEFTLK